MLAVQWRGISVGNPSLYEKLEATKFCMISGPRFELDRLQRHHFESIQTFNEYLREEYHSIQDLLWKSGHGALYGDIPER